MSLDPVKLASDLIKIKSITPHGQEAINLIKSILENHGFDCKILTFGEGEDEVVNLYGKSTIIFSCCSRFYGWK